MLINLVISDVSTSILSIPSTYITVVAFDKSFRMVDPINLPGAWLNPDSAIRFGLNERYQAIVKNQDGSYDLC